MLRDRIIAPILAHDQPAFRVWAPACGTGADVYATAAQFTAAMAAGDDNRPIQVFGTDSRLDDLCEARIGAVPDSAMATMPAALRRFFAVRDGHWIVGRALRERCVFAPHDLRRDPPLPRLDLIVCRSVPGGPLAAAVLLPQLHRALNPGGLLLLEASGIHADPSLFTMLDPAARLLRRAPGV